MATGKTKGETKSGQFGDWRALLKNRNVAWLWTGQLISQTGEGLSKVALLWFVYKMTGSALKMTTIGILQTVPPLLFGPFVGVLLDRIPKRLAMIVIDIARACLLAVIPLLDMWDMLTLPSLYGLVFITAMFSMAFGPALSSTEPLIVKEEQLTQINALDQSTMTIGQLIGPAISGILIAAMGAQNVLFVNAGTFLISAFCKIPLRIPQKVAATRFDHPFRQALHDLKEGFAFIFVRHRLLVVLMAISSLYTLGATGFIYLLPVIGKDILHADSLQVGWLWASLSAGILVTTVWLLGSKPIGLCRRVWMIGIAAGLAGGAALLLGSIRFLPLAALLIAVIGASSGLVNPFVSASLQERSPKEILARVFGVFNTGYLAFAMLGMTVFGWLADAYDPAVSVAGVGVVSVASGLFTFAMLPWCYRYARAESGKQALAATG
jgi:DHA3 family macrolide efflux protein-like MFS transporter